MSKLGYLFLLFLLLYSDCEAGFLGCFAFVDKEEASSGSYGVFFLRGINDVSTSDLGGTCYKLDWTFHGLINGKELMVSFGHCSPVNGLNYDAFADSLDFYEVNKAFFNNLLFKVDMPVNTYNFNRECRFFYAHQQLNDVEQRLVNFFEQQDADPSSLKIDFEHFPVSNNFMSKQEHRCSTVRFWRQAQTENNSTDNSTEDIYFVQQYCVQGFEEDKDVWVVSNAHREIKAYDATPDYEKKKGNHLFKTKKGKVIGIYPKYIEGKDDPGITQRNGSVLEIQFENCGYNYSLSPCESSDFNYFSLYLNADSERKTCSATANYKPAHNPLMVGRSLLLKGRKIYSLEIFVDAYPFQVFYKLSDLNKSIENVSECDFSPMASEKMSSKGWEGCFPYSLVHIQQRESLVTILSADFTNSEDYQIFKKADYSVMQMNEGRETRFKHAQATTENDLDLSRGGNFVSAPSSEVHTSSDNQRTNIALSEACFIRRTERGVSVMDREVRQTATFSPEIEVSSYSTEPQRAEIASVGEQCVRPGVSSVHSLSKNDSKRTADDCVVITDCCVCLGANNTSDRENKFKLKCSSMNCNALICRSCFETMYLPLSERKPDQCPVCRNEFGDITAKWQVLNRQ